jgi:hypothetical protein
MTRQHAATDVAWKRPTCITTRRRAPLMVLGCTATTGSAWRCSLGTRCSVRSPCRSCHGYTCVLWMFRSSRRDMPGNSALNSSWPWSCACR